MSGLPAVPRYRDLIGATPMVDITALAELQPGMAGKVKVFGKCEFMNPVSPRVSAPQPHRAHRAHGLA